MVNNARNFGTIDAVCFAIELEVDLVVGNVSHHAFDVVQAFAVPLEHDEEIAGRLQLANLVPLLGEVFVKVLKANAAT